MVFGNVFKKLLPRLVDDAVPASYLLKFMGLVLPFSLIFTIPWGFLTAILLVFGRLSANNEIISMRMAGMSFQRICAAVFALAIAFSAFSYYINVSVAPKCEKEMRGILYDLWTDDPLSIFEADTVIDQLDGMRIYIREKEGNILRDFQLTQIEGTKPVAILRSPEVHVEIADDGNTLNLIMKDSVIEPYEVAGQPDTLMPATYIGEQIRPISLIELKKKARRDSISNHTSASLKERLKKGIDSDSGKPLTENNISAIKTEISKRTSFSLACLTFAFLGIPLGITAQRRETSIGFVLGLAIASIYFFLILLIGMASENPSVYPQLLMWLPNVIFLALGLRMFWKLVKR